MVNLFLSVYWYVKDKEKRKNEKKKKKAVYIKIRTGYLKIWDSYFFTQAFCLPGSCIRSIQSFLKERDHREKKRKKRRIDYHTVLYHFLHSCFTVSCFLFFTLLLRE